MGRCAGRAKKSSQKKPTWVEESKEKSQLEFTTLVNLRTRRDEKGAPISAPSIHVGALVGASSLWPKNYCFLLNHLQVYCYCFVVVNCHVQKNCPKNRDERKNILKI
jgi:hypothetical protein